MVLVGQGRSAPLASVTCSCPTFFRLLYSGVSLSYTCWSFSPPLQARLSKDTCASLRCCWRLILSVVTWNGFNRRVLLAVIRSLAPVVLNTCTFVLVTVKDCTRTFLFSVGYWFYMFLDKQFFEFWYESFAVMGHWSPTCFVSLLGLVGLSILTKVWWSYSLCRQVLFSGLYTLDTKQLCS